MGREEQQERQADVHTGWVSLLCACIWVCIRLKPYRARCAWRKTSTSGIVDGMYEQWSRHRGCSESLYQSALLRHAAEQLWD